ncbi:MAG: putative quinol monooxygenase [Bacteroidota bacterium]
MKRTINARINVKPEAIEQFISLAKTMVENSNTEQGCLCYKLYQEVGNPQSFIFYEVYENQDAVDFHNSSGHFKTFIEQISDLVSEKSQVDVF